MPHPTCSNLVLSLVSAISVNIPYQVIAAQPVSPPATTDWAVVESAASNSLSSQAELAKPAIVRVTNGCEAKTEWKGKTYEASIGASGSGWFVHHKGYIVTNAHVVDQDIEDCKFSLEMDLVGQILADSTSFSLRDLFDRDAVNRIGALREQIASQVKLTDFKSFQTVILPNGDKMPYQIKVMGEPIGRGKGKDVAIIKIEVKNASVLKLASSIKLLEPIMAIGYPSSGEVGEKLTTEASFTPGIISAKKILPDGLQVVQFSAPTTHGGSGGPILNGRGEVAAMVTFANRDQVAGYAFGVTASTILEFLEKAEITNDEGSANRLYREGIELYQRGLYGRALSKLLELQRLFPQHSEVGRVIAECLQQINRNGIKFEGEVGNSASR